MPNYVLSSGRVREVCEGACALCDKSGPKKLIFRSSAVDLLEALAQAVEPTGSDQTVERSTRCRAGVAIAHHIDASSAVASRFGKCDKSTVQA